MSNERNELAALLNREGAYCGTCGYEGGPDECSDCRECLTRYADAIHAAGYRKHREITTAAELDALGFEAVVIDPCGTPAVCQRSGLDWCEWALGGSGELIDSETLLMSGVSCTVLHEGGPL